MSKQVYIKGQKTILRDLTEEDIREIYYWTYEAEDREHLNWNGPYYKRETMPYKEFLNKYYKEHLEKVNTDQSRQHLVIEADGKLIGTVGWYWEDQVTNWLNNGIVIYDSTYWSGGYGTEAFYNWTDYIFNTMMLFALASQPGQETLE